MKLTSKMYFLATKQMRNMKEPDKPYHGVEFAGGEDGTFESFVSEEEYNRLSKLKKFQEVEVQLDYVRTAKGNNLYYSGFRLIS